MYCDFKPDKRYQLADWRIRYASSKGTIQLIFSDISDLSTRPLPLEMLEYARSDTHYLLYIYDNLRNALLERGASAVFAEYTPEDITLETPVSRLTPSDGQAWLFKEVLARSNQTSLKVFERDIYNAEGRGSSGWYTLARKWNKGSMTQLQKEVFKTVHHWRDSVAREEDESTRSAALPCCIFTPLTTRQIRPPKSLPLSTR
jgi:exosome complex exonuclease RRP6